MPIEITRLQLIESRDVAMQSRIKVGLAGISGYGSLYLDALMPMVERQEIDLVGVVDPAPQRCRHLSQLERYGISIHSDLSSLYNDKQHPNLMMLATPIHLHAQQACWSLQHGSNVLCEKPLAATVRDARRIVTESTTTSRFVAMGYQWSYSAAIQALKADIASGALGRPKRLKSLVFFPRNADYFARNGWAGRMKTAGGEAVFDGPANNAAAHYLHNMFYVLGSSRQTSAMPATTQAELYRANDIENHDTAAIRAVTEDGVEILFYASHTVPASMGPMFRFDFENAVVTYSAESVSGIVARFRNGNIKRYGDPMLDRTAKIRESIAAAAGDGEVACPARAAMPHVVCIAAAHASMPRITSMPQNLVTVSGSDGDKMLTVNGLHSTLIQCFDQWLLPSEFGGLEWARPGAVITTPSVLDPADRSESEALPPRLQEAWSEPSATNGKIAGHA